MPVLTPQQRAPTPYDAAADDVTVVGRRTGSKAKSTSAAAAGRSMSFTKLREKTDVYDTASENEEDEEEEEEEEEEGNDATLNSSFSKKAIDMAKKFTSKLSVSKKK
jgi:hypothetical protein